MNTQFDTQKNLKNELIQHAEDSAIWRSGKSIPHLATLCLKVLSKLKTWADEWGLKISKDKN